MTKRFENPALAVCFNQQAKPLVKRHNSDESTTTKK